MSKIIKPLDLRWGNPTFLSPYWDFTPIKVDGLKKPMDYVFGGTASLKSEITRLHASVKNAVTENRHIVIGPGATALLLGLLYVLKNNPELLPNPRKRVSSAWATPPHYSRFKELAKISGLGWGRGKEAIRITTMPNNPDGRLPTREKADILDLCYLWPQYAEIVAPQRHPIMVFSLSKATGHASTRIGWAVIENPMLAKKLEEHIEHTSNGVSIDAQLKAEKVVESQLKTDFTVFDDGKTTLSKRWEVILQNKHKLPFTLLNDKGMFIWASGKCPEEIISLSGKALGTSAKKFRLNLGCSDLEFCELLKILRV